jgi:N-hydroxyarylamine O-acetyltransferase
MTTDSSDWPSPHTLGKLNRADALAYLERINLPSSVVDEEPSLDLLRRLQSAHLISVPFESTSVHVKDWKDDEAEIELGGGETVRLSEGAFNHIVSLRRGGYCFSLNGTFPSLLRWFGFNVSECLAKVNAVRKDPDVHGVDWEALSHL